MANDAHFNSSPAFEGPQTLSQGQTIAAQHAKAAVDALGMLYLGKVIETIKVGSGYRVTVHFPNGQGTIEVCIDRNGNRSLHGVKGTAEQAIRGWLDTAMGPELRMEA